jgi:aryl-alcohol dehydrogenase-like predicted oxidoreductase
MKYAIMGNTGLVVSKFSLGAMTFGLGVKEFRGFKYKVDQQGADDMVKMSLDAGINAFDTADMYAYGKSEEMLGKAIGNKRKEVIISTKVGNRMSEAMIDYGSSFQHILAATEASIKRLGTDYIDILLIHFDDVLTPIEESIRALDNLVNRGLVRYAGFSNFLVWRASAGYWLQKKHGYAKFVAAQMNYSLLNRDIEHEMVPFLLNSGIGMQVWSPLSGGFLTGKYTKENPTGGGGRLSNFKFPRFKEETGYNVVQKTTEIGKKYDNAPASQVALAWLLSKPVVSTVILGASDTKQLADNLKAMELQLKQADVEELDNFTMPNPVYPSWLYSGSRDPKTSEGLEK